MSDQDGIRRTIASYAQLVDAGRLDEWAELYAEDAVHESGGEVYRGREAIRRFIGAVPLEGVRHFTANSVIDVDGDTASACTDWIALRAGEDGFVIVQAGRYRDRLVRRGGAWYFAERRTERWEERGGTP